MDLIFYGVDDYLFQMLFFSLLRNDSFREGLCFAADVFLFIFLFQCEISEIHWPNGTKFCTTISTRPNLIMPVQYFWRPTPKKF